MLLRDFVNVTSFKSLNFLWKYYLQVLQDSLKLAFLLVLHFESIALNQTMIYE
jgi:hypothetical protein